MCFSLPNSSLMSRAQRGVGASLHRTMFLLCSVGKDNVECVHAASRGKAHCWVRMQAMLLFGDSFRVHTVCCEKRRDVRVTP